MWVFYWMTPYLIFGMQKLIWVNFDCFKVKRCSFQLHKFLKIFNILNFNFFWYRRKWCTYYIMTWKSMNNSSYRIIIYIFFILGFPWGLVRTGGRREGSGRGHHQTVWGAVIQELRLLQNPGPSHQQRLPHGIHYSIERGELLMENNFFSKATSTGISLCQKNC